ncbi:alcohol dehydrogenase catalytic domain-containing protein [Sphaerisporangium rhizosphaerae]|uniref:Alcohol dehydrogenase catalytic domain-containing protein n=1 Tax=Sphaerisporangium rhizosphaerae TaxID=2269375 RepID=A0ABW2P3T6_9ACTN
MRAIVTARPGSDDEVELVDLPDPRPAAGQIRIRMAGAAVNAADLHIIDASRDEVRAGGPAPRLGLGLDVAGVVDMVGSGVHDLAVGTPVAALHFPHAPHAAAGTAAEYVIVPVSDAAPVPNGVELLDAATVPLNSLTAAQLLALLGPSQGRRLLITGAAGGVGGYAVALAARAGWRVTALARATDDGFLTRAGAAETRTTLDGASGFDAVLDTALLNEAALRPVRDHGAYVGVFPGLEPTSERGITVTSAVVVPDGALLREMLALTARGVLEPRRAGTVPMEKAAYAYRAFRDGAHRGRWVLTS